MLDDFVLCFASHVFPRKHEPLQISFVYPLGVVVLLGRVHALICAALLLLCTQQAALKGASTILCPSAPLLPLLFATVLWYPGH